MKTPAILSRRLRYFRFIGALVTNDYDGYLPLETEPPASLDDWGAEDLDLLIAEGRRRQAEEHALLASIRGRAQIVLSTSLVVLGVLSSSASGLVLRTPTLKDALLGLGFASGVLATLGAAAVLVVGARMSGVDLISLTADGRESGLRHTLAADYLTAAGMNRSTLRTWHFYFYEAVVWLLASAACLVTVLV